MNNTAGFLVSTYAIINDVTFMNINFLISIDSVLKYLMIPEANIVSVKLNFIPSS